MAEDLVLFKKKFVWQIYKKDGERERERGGGGKRENEREGERERTREREGERERTREREGEREDSHFPCLFC